MPAWRIHATNVQDDARRVSREHRDVVTSTVTCALLLLFLLFSLCSKNIKKRTWTSRLNIYNLALSKSASIAIAATVQFENKPRREAKILSTKANTLFEIDITIFLFT